MTELLKSARIRALFAISLSVALSAPPLAVWQLNTAYAKGIEDGPIEQEAAPVEPEAEPEAELESEPEAVPEDGPGPAVVPEDVPAAGEEELVPEGEPEPEPAAPEIPAASDPEATPEAEPEIVPEAEPEPELEAEPEIVPEAEAGSIVIVTEVTNGDVPSEGFVYEIYDSAGNPVAKVASKSGIAFVDGLADGDYVVKVVASSLLYLIPEETEISFNISGGSLISWVQLCSYETYPAEGKIIWDISFNPEVGIPTTWLQLLRYNVDSDGNQISDYEPWGDVVELQPGTTSHVWQVPITNSIGQFYRCKIQEVDADGNDWVPEGFEKTQGVSPLVIKNTLVRNPGPDQPDTPDTPDTPSGPDQPDTPDTPDTPSGPDQPDTPDTPDTPSGPDQPDTPDTPDTPSGPDQPDTPDTPDTPSGPDQPDTPDTPDQPDAPSVPVQPSTAAARQASAAASEQLPKTGDSVAPRIAAALSVLGLCAAAAGMAIRRRNDSM